MICFVLSLKCIASAKYLVRKGAHRMKLHHLPVEANWTMLSKPNWFFKKVPIWAHKQKGNHILLTVSQ